MESANNTIAKTYPYQYMGTAGQVELMQLLNEFAFGGIEFPQDSNIKHVWLNDLINSQDKEKVYEQLTNTFHIVVSPQEVEAKLLTQFLNEKKHPSFTSKDKITEYINAQLKANKQKVNYFGADRSSVLEAIFPPNIIERKLDKYNSSKNTLYIDDMYKQHVLVPNKAAFEKMNVTLGKGNPFEAYESFIVNLLCIGFYPKLGMKPQQMYFGLVHYTLDQGKVAPSMSYQLYATSYYQAEDSKEYVFASARNQVGQSVMAKLNGDSGFLFNGSYSQHVLAYPKQLNSSILLGDQLSSKTFLLDSAQQYYSAGFAILDGMLGNVTNVNMNLFEDVVANLKDRKLNPDKYVGEKLVKRYGQQTKITKERVSGAVVAIAIKQIMAKHKCDEDKAQEIYFKAKTQVTQTQVNYKPNIADASQESVMGKRPRPEQEDEEYDDDKHKLDIGTQSDLDEEEVKQPTTKRFKTSKTPQQKDVQEDLEHKDYFPTVCSSVKWTDVFKLLVEPYQAKNFSQKNLQLHKVLATLQTRLFELQNQSGRHMETLTIPNLTSKQKTSTQAQKKLIDGQVADATQSIIEVEAQIVLNNKTHAKGEEVIEVSESEEKVMMKAGSTKKK